MIDHLEQSRIINCAYYAGELSWLRQDLTRVRRGKLTCCVLLLQDNAPAHKSQVAMHAARLNVALKSFLIPHILLIGSF